MPYCNSSLIVAKEHMCGIHESVPTDRESQFHPITKHAGSVANWKKKRPAVNKERKPFHEREPETLMVTLQVCVSESTLIQ